MDTTIKMMAEPAIQYIGQHQLTDTVSVPHIVRLLMRGNSHRLFEKIEHARQKGVNPQVEFPMGEIMYTLPIISGVKFFTMADQADVIGIHALADLQFVEELIKQTRYQQIRGLRDQLSQWLDSQEGDEPDPGIYGGFEDLI